VCLPFISQTALAQLKEVVQEERVHAAARSTKPPAAARPAKATKTAKAAKAVAAANDAYDTWRQALRAQLQKTFA